MSTHREERQQLLNCPKCTRIRLMSLLMAFCSLFSTCTDRAVSQSKVPNAQSSTTQELTDSLILKLIFGNVAQKKEVGYIKNYDSFYANASLDSTTFSAKNWANLGREGSTHYFVESIYDIEEAGVEKKLVILSGEGISCHVCAGVSGAAVFSEEANQWKLEVWENDIAVLGTTGYPVDQIEINPIGKGRYAIVLKRGSIWQGVEFRFFTLVLYEKGIFKEVLDKPITFSSNNWANAEPDGMFTKAYSYTAPVYFDWRKAGEYPNMVMHFQGTTLSKGGTESILLNQKVRFEYKEGKYMTQQKIPSE